MKRILFIAFLMIRIPDSFAQGNLFTFNNIVSGEERSKDAILKGSYAFLEISGTDEELYQYTKEWINRSYTGKGEGIISTPGSEYLKVQGHKDNLFYRLYRDSICGHDAKYILSYKFKDGKIKVELITLSIFPKHTHGTWRELGTVQVVQIDGSPNVEGMNEIETLKNYFNPMIESLEAYIHSK